MFTYFLHLDFKLLSFLSLIYYLPPKPVILLQVLKYNNEVTEISSLSLPLTIKIRLREGEGSDVKPKLVETGKL